MIIPITKEGTFEHSNKKSSIMRQPRVEATNIDSWKNLSPLEHFNQNNQRWWAREEIENFLIPTLTRRSLLRDKFDNFKLDNLNVHMPLAFNEHPIKFETFTAESDKYVLTLNVKQFKPEEIQVSITDDMISITGKHEERQNELNFSCQEYSRKHSLPAGVKAEDIRCDMSSDGVLKITAPKKVIQSLPNHERRIPIQHVGLPAIRV